MSDHAAASLRAARNLRRAIADYRPPVGRPLTDEEIAFEGLIEDMAEARKDAGR